MPASSSAFDFPKIDLYRRLGGSFDADALAGLGGRRPPPGPLSPERDLDNLQVTMQTVEAWLADQGLIISAVQLLATQAQAEGIRHTELVVDFDSLGVDGKASTAALLEVLSAAVSDFTYPGSPSFGWLIGIGPDAPLASVQNAVALASAGLGKGILGLAARISGDDLLAIDQAARADPALDVPVVVEFSPGAQPGSWSGRLQSLAPRRIVFGRQLALEMPAVAWIREHRPAVIVCPTAERLLGSQGAAAGVSVQAMIQAGMQVCVGTWAPALMESGFDSGLDILLGEEQLSAESLSGLMLAGAQASLLDSRSRRDLERQLEAEIFGFPAG